ncbi:hypothetical protein ABEF95_004329 [Exophiala dermatitidis]
MSSTSGQPCYYIRSDTVAITVSKEPGVEDNAGQATFYVDRSLISDNSVYFESLLMERDKPVSLNVPHLSESNFKVFMRWLCRGEIVLDDEGSSVHQDLMDFAIAIAACEFHNIIMDLYRMYCLLDEDFVQTLHDLERSGHNKAKLKLFLCEKAAYEIVKNGWVNFTAAGGQAWKRLIAASATAPETLENLMKEVDRANEQAKHDKLEDPAETEVCRYEVHGGDDCLDQGGNPKATCPCCGHDFD